MYTYKVRLHPNNKQSTKTKTYNKLKRRERSREEFTWGFIKEI